MKKVISFGAVAVVFILAAWFGWSARREASYRATLSRYKQDLSTGMTRSEVQKHLDSRSVQYLDDVTWVAWRPDGLHAIGIPLGPTSGPLGCTWTAYVELKFELSAKSRTATSSDRLKEIEISRIGRDCV